MTASARLSLWPFIQVGSCSLKPQGRETSQKHANMNPLIGISMSIDHGEKLRKGIEYVYVKRTYARAVRQAGGRPFFICPDLSPEHAVDIFDGIIIPGGDDVPPILYT